MTRHQQEVIQLHVTPLGRTRKLYRVRAAASAPPVLINIFVVFFLRLFIPFVGIDQRLSLPPVLSD
jgi:hypothetical protein